MLKLLIAHVEDGHCLTALFHFITEFPYNSFKSLNYCNFLMIDEKITCAANLNTPDSCQFTEFLS